jgi:hypothetical protein
MNEESLQKSSLDLTLTYKSCDENPKPEEVCPHLEIRPLRTLYYQISLNSHTLMILLYVDPTFSDEPKTICEFFNEIKDTSIFAWSSILVVRHYRWLCELI